ncbi:MAG: hypothetical protein ACOH16_13750 [Propionibacteriaceae bacterium]
MMSQLNPAFRTVMRGYEPTEVDRTLGDLRKAVEQARTDAANSGVAVAKLQSQLSQLEEQLANEKARASVLESGATTAAEPTFQDFGTRVGKILTLANDEAKDLRTRANAEADKLTSESEAAAEQAKASADRYVAEVTSKADADAARIVEAARQQADEILDYADREATTRREEAEAVYEHQRARAAAAAADFEKTLAERRNKSATEFTAAMAAHEQTLAAAQERHTASELEADRTKAEARAQAEAIMKFAREEAASHVDSARQSADKIRRETDRELQAATSRRDAITAQLTNVRQMLATLGGSSIGSMFGDAESVAGFGEAPAAPADDDTEEIVAAELEDSEIEEGDDVDEDEYDDEEYDEELEDDESDDAEVEDENTEKANA